MTIATCKKPHKHHIAAYQRTFNDHTNVLYFRIYWFKTLLYLYVHGGIGSFVPNIGHNGYTIILDFDEVFIIYEVYYIFKFLCYCKSISCLAVGFDVSCLTGFQSSMRVLFPQYGYFISHEHSWALTDYSS